MELHTVISRHLLWHSSYEKRCHLWHIHHLLLLYAHSSLLQFFQQINTMHREHQERVVVYLTTHHVDHCRQMLARHSPVWAGAFHLQIAPSVGKYGEAKMFAYL